MMRMWFGKEKERLGSGTEARYWMRRETLS